MKQSLDDISCWAAADKELGVFFPPKMEFHILPTIAEKLNANTKLISGGDEGAWGTESAPGCAWFCILPAWQSQQ